MSEAKAPESGAAILIAASSGRALAAAARRAGYRPLVADLFDDDDTRALCADTRRAGDPQTGFVAESLLGALKELAQDHAAAGLVYGAGFEDRVELLAEIAQCFALFGNRPETVRRVKDPGALSALCANGGIPHPEIRFAAPEDPEGWLVKCVGGAGGGHVAPAGAWRASNESVYFQRIAPGEPVSLLCLCGEGGADVLGVSRQWAAPAPGEPYRFGGCVRPAQLSREAEKAMGRAAETLSDAIGLLGLNSFDFLVEGDAFALVEINPRPGATLDIFEDRSGLLLKAHIVACLGGARLPVRGFEGAAAAAIAYTPKAVAAMPALDWPAWAADRQKPGTTLGLNDPLCTIKASAADPATARKLVVQRTALILNEINDLGTGATR